MTEVDDYSCLHKIRRSRLVIPTYIFLMILKEKTSPQCSARISLPFRVVYVKCRLFWTEEVFQGSGSLSRIMELLMNCLLFLRFCGLFPLAALWEVHKVTCYERTEVMAFGTIKCVRCLPVTSFELGSSPAAVRVAAVESGAPQTSCFL